MDKYSTLESLINSRESASKALRALNGAKTLNLGEQYVWACEIAVGLTQVFLSEAESNYTLCWNSPSPANKLP